MARPVRGVLAVEGVQTGDGRIIVAGALTWPELPLPLAWMVDGDQHADMTEMCPQIGTIDTITRGQGGEIAWTGMVDDQEPDGAEAVRRMDAGTAPLGNRFGVSIDPDDYEVEVVATDPQNAPDEVVMTAAAGDGDVPDGEVIMEDSADAVLERYTALRIRGATLCSVAAFADAYCELADMAETAPPADAPPAEPAAVVASACECGGTCPSCATTVSDNRFAAPVQIAAAGLRSAPPATWFDDPHLDVPTPLMVLADGRVFGHLATWSTCHTGIGERCVLAPRSATGYAYFTTGEVVCADGSRRRVGQLTMDTGHAPLHLDHRAAAAHYDGGPGALQWADVAVGEDRHGLWVAGAVRPGLSDEQLHAARAQALSGDWRSIGGGLELVAALSVPVPGFPVVNLAAAAARGLTPSPRARVQEGRTVALVAAGVVRPAPPWQAELDRRDAAVHARLDMLTALVRPLLPLAADAIVAAVEAQDAERS